MQYTRLAGGARLQADLTLTATPNPNQVRQEVRTSNVTLGSIAMNELDCPRLVFITPYTPPEKRTIKTRVTEKITKAVKDRHRLIFLDPVTGTAVPCGPDGQGYVLKLPSHFLRQHGSKIRDGLIVHVGGRYHQGPAREEMDGRGKVLAPGFIDIHT